MLYKTLTQGAPPGYGPLHTYYDLNTPLHHTVPSDFAPCVHPSKPLTLSLPSDEREAPLIITLVFARMLTGSPRRRNRTEKVGSEPVLC